MDNFSVFARKKGKDILVGKTETADQARILLRTELKDTLRASGIIKDKEGKKISPFGFGLTNGEFRLSFKDPKRLVQRKGRRLGTTPETTSIQFFRSQARSGGFF